MDTNIKQAQELLFGATGIGASNFKMFPGLSRDVTPDEIAAEILKAIGEVASGTAQEVALD